MQIQGSSAHIGGATDGGPCSGDCNLISGNIKDNILLDNGESGAVIKGNFLGPAITGTATPSQGTFAASVDTKGNNDTIGGTNGTSPGGACTGDCNLISGNEVGVLIAPDGTGTHILGNFIGPNVTVRSPSPTPTAWTTPAAT